MEEKLADLYNKLANHMADMIPVEWDDINYLGEVEKERLSCSSVFYFTDMSTNGKVESNSIPDTYHVSEDIYMELLSELNGILLEIYDCFIEYQQEPWEQLSLYFNHAGKFEIDYLYDVMKKDDGGQLGREVLWAYHAFGYLPEEGTYSRKILDRYLEQLQE